jgi:hypothetical protein
MMNAEGRFQLLRFGIHHSTFDINPHFFSIVVQTRVAPETPEVY